MQKILVMYQNGDDSKCNGRSLSIIHIIEKSGAENSGCGILPQSFHEMSLGDCKQL